MTRMDTKSQSTTGDKKTRLALHRVIIATLPYECCRGGWKRLVALRLPTIRGNHERQLLTLTAEAMGTSDRYTISQIRDEHRALPAARKLVQSKCDFSDL
jgi:hypothetical protein